MTALLQKTCTKCKATQPLDGFHKHRTTRDGRAVWCKRCAGANAKRWNEENPERVKLRARVDKLTRKYGLTLADYDRILESQGGVCAVCGASAPVNSSLDVDHCHSTGVVRGLLCRDCNLGVGKFKDDPAALRRAADYLERQP